MRYRSQGSRFDLAMESRLSCLANSVASISRNLSFFMFFGIIGVAVEVLGAGTHLFAFVSWPRSLSSIAAINGPDSGLQMSRIIRNPLL
jgi:hypothetical protein